MKFQIHIVDDEPTVAQSLKRILNSNERQIEISHSGKEAMEKAEHIPYDLYLLDYRLKEMDGISLLNQLKIKNPEAIYIFITAFGNVETAVRAMKAGAFDFVQKDQNPDVIRFTVQRALDTLRLRKEVHLLKNSFSRKNTAPDCSRIANYERDFRNSRKICPNRLYCVNHWRNGYR